MKWLEEFGKGFINLGNILIGVVAFKGFYDNGFNTGSFIAIMGGIAAYIFGILAVQRSDNDK